MGQPSLSLRSLREREAATECRDGAPQRTKSATRGRGRGTGPGGGQNGVVSYQPALWTDPATDHRSRIVANSADRSAWLKARSGGVTATDVARLSSVRALQVVAEEKLHGSSFTGNAYTDHGLAREPEIARWVRTVHGIEPSLDLYHAESNERHLATPDGIRAANGHLELAEIKTTTKAWRSIPRSYLRQVWWQQYVLGAERTLVVWEQHDNFVPIGPEPCVQWVDRDENEIHRLVGLADQLLGLLRR
ncbi:MAG: YqaJ viral recombinase family protein [Micrococcales bacterium]|nr:YqaJ viral recombinase family protein [Micrococcales bacterium]